MRKSFIALALLLSFTAAVAAQSTTQTKPKSSDVKIDDDQTYVVLSTKRIQTMEKELDEVAARGFRVMYGAPTQQYDMAILLQRVQAAGGAPYSYKVLATSRHKTMEKELAEAGAQGYRLLPRTAITKMGFITNELVMLAEREPNSTKSYEYKLLMASKETKLHKKIDEAIAQGYAPITMIIMGDHIVVVEKEGTATPKEGAARQ
ncbi:MAG: hypothetical protein QOG00_3132 [Pyrinomonadaceae bacterium]|nr:hypothetical protein [Pyrinomonadaceae bacterium]MDX6271296.1 hypothetical protein [Acidobacteriota bacterium]